MIADIIFCGPRKYSFFLLIGFLFKLFMFCMLKMDFFLFVQKDNKFYGLRQEKFKKIVCRDKILSPIIIMSFFQFFLEKKNPTKSHKKLDFFFKLFFHFAFDKHGEETFPGFPKVLFNKITDF